MEAQRLQNPIRTPVQLLKGQNIFQLVNQRVLQHILLHLQQLILDQHQIYPL